MWRICADEFVLLFLRILPVCPCENLAIFPDIRRRWHIAPFVLWLFLVVPTFRVALWCQPWQVKIPNELAFWGEVYRLLAPRNFLPFNSSRYFPYRTMFVLGSEKMVKTGKHTHMWKWKSGKANVRQSKTTRRVNVRIVVGTSRMSNVRPKKGTLEWSTHELCMNSAYGWHVKISLPPLFAQEI